MTVPIYSAEFIQTAMGKAAADYDCYLPRRSWHGEIQALISAYHGGYDNNRLQGQTSIFGWPVVIMGSDEE